MGFLWNKWCSGLLRKDSPANRISSWGVVSSQLLCHVKEAGIQGFQVYFKIYSANLSNLIFSFVIEVHFICKILGHSWKSTIGGRNYIEKILFKRSKVKNKINWRNFFWHMFSHWLRNPLTWEWHWANYEAVIWAVSFSDVCITVTYTKLIFWTIKWVNCRQIISICDIWCCVTAFCWKCLRKI